MPLAVAWLPCDPHSHASAPHTTAPYWQVLKSRMGFHEPNIEIGGSIVYEEGEDAMTYPFEHLPLEVR